MYRWALKYGSLIEFKRINETITNKIGNAVIYKGVVYILQRISRKANVPTGYMLQKKIQLGKWISFLSIISYICLTDSMYIRLYMYIYMCIYGDFIDKLMLIHYMNKIQGIKNKYLGVILIYWPLK